MAGNRTSIRSRWRAAVPSPLTSIRLLALPGVILLWLGELRLEAIGLFVLMLLSDVLDGWAARRLGAETMFGAYFDVVTDMAVILGLLAVLSASGAIPVWLPVVPAVVAVTFLATSRRTAPRYDPIGKHCGTALYVLIGVLLWGVGLAVRVALVEVIVALSAVVLVGRCVARRSIEPAGQRERVPSSRGTEERRSGFEG